MTLEGFKTTFTRYDWKGKKYVHLSGLNYEARTAIYRETATYLVIHVPGRKCWVDRLSGAVYTNPEFVIFKKQGQNELVLVKDIDYKKGGLAKARMQMVEFLAYGK